MQNWIDREQKQGNLSLQRVLTAQSEAWKERGYLRGDLWTKNSRLKLLQDILEKPDKNWFNQLEEKFVKRSICQKKADKLTLWTGLSAIFLGLASAATYLYIQLQQTELRERVTRVENLLTTNPVDALVLAIEATGKSQSILKPFLEFDLVQTNLLKALEISQEENLLKWQDRQTDRSTVSQLIISRNNQTIVSVDDRNPVRIWNLEGQPLVELPKTTENLISSVAITSDGQTIVTANENGKLSLWSRDGQFLKEMFHQQGGLLFGTVVTISPDGEIIASGGYDGTLKLWGRDGTQFCNPKNHSKSVSGIRINDNNQIISIDEDGIVKQWNKQCQIFATNKLQDYERLQSDESSGQKITMSANGQYIIGWTGGNSDDYSGTIKVWNKEGKLIWSKQDIYNNKQKPNLYDYDYLTKLSISNDGQIITAGSHQGKIQIWQWHKLGNNYKNIDDLPASHIGQITSLDISFNKNIIVSGGYDGSIRIWDNNKDFLGLGKPLKKEQKISSVAASKDGEIIVSSDGDNQKLILWKNQQPKEIFKGVNKFIDTYMPVDINYDGKVIVSGHNDGIIRVWNQQGQLQNKIFDNQTQSKPVINSLAMSTDGKTLVSSHDDGCVRIWQLEGKLISKFCKYQVNSVDINANGQFIAVGFNEGVHLLNRSGQTIWKSSPIQNEIVSVKISADGNTIIGRYGDKVYFWNRQGKQLNEKDIQDEARRAKGHETVLNAISLSPDGQLIATDGIGSTIWLWNRKNELVAKGSWQHNTLISSITFTPDGQYIVTGSRDGEIRLWRSGWKTWLEVACNRLRYHPVLIDPQTETAKNALDTCQKYVWPTKQTKLRSTQL